MVLLSEFFEGGQCDWVGIVFQRGDCGISLDFCTSFCNGAILFSLSVVITMILLCVIFDYLDVFSLPVSQCIKTSIQPGNVWRLQWNLW